MSNDQTPDIEQLCREALEDDKRATPGPWRQGNVETYHVFCPYAGALAPELGRVLLRMNTHFEHEADTAFIAAARTREPLLAAAWLAERKEAERLRAELAETKLERDDMLGAPRGKEAEELRAGIERLIENESHDVYELGDVVLRTDIQSLLDRVDARDSLAYLVQRDEIKKLRAQLAAMTAARDEACDLAECIVGEPPARITELRAVGKEQS